MAAVVWAAAGSSASGDPVLAYCRALKPGGVIADLVTQGFGPPGKPPAVSVRRTAIDGKSFTIVTYVDGVALTWHDGYVTAKRC
jgi:hypothetical protein